MTLAAIVACQVGNLFACRSEWVSAWKMSWTNNQLLWLGVAVECAALVWLYSDSSFARKGVATFFIYVGDFLRSISHYFTSSSKSSLSIDLEP